jgi:hypothetical protein
MDKTTAGLLGAVSALALTTPLATPAAAEAPAVPNANSYAELLAPIPNAVERLKLADAQEARLIRTAAATTGHDHHHQAAGHDHHHQQGAAGHDHHHQAAGKTNTAATAGHDHHHQQGAAAHDHHHQQAAANHAHN